MKLNEGLEIVKAIIKQKKGTFKLLNEPTVIGAKEEEETEDLIAEIEGRNADNSDESEDQEEGIEVDVEDDNVEVQAENSDEEQKEW